MEKPREEKRATRRKRFVFSQALDRFISDAEAGKFPIRHRRGDCERLNMYPKELNRLHASGQVEELRRYIFALCLAADAEEKR